MKIERQQIERIVVGKMSIEPTDDKYRPIRFVFRTKAFNENFTLEVRQNVEASELQQLIDGMKEILSQVEVAT